MIKEMINKHKKTIMFLLFCGLTTLVYLISYYVMALVLKLSSMSSIIVALIIAFLCAYVANRKRVFKNNKKRNNLDIIIYISFIILVFIFLLNSPLHIWRGANIERDSSVFKTIALMMQKGYMPYTSSFDHKGPVIYIYNYLGNMISSYRGVWVFEFVSLWITTCYLFKIARLKCDRVVSYIITLLSLSLLFIYFESGNLTEEYALPFITCSLYIFLDYLNNNIINKKRLIICGLSFGAVLLLRPNMVGTWFVFCLAIIVDCIKNKKINSLLKFILYFIIGMSIIIIPIIIWLMLNGSLKDFWDSYIVFNGIYSSAAITSESTKIMNIWNSLFIFINSNVILATFIIIISLKKNKNNIIYLIYMIVSLFLICLSGRTYLHYMMIFVPIIVYPFSELFDYFNNDTKKDNSNILKMTLIIYLASNVIIPAWIPTIQNIPKYYHFRNENNITEDIRVVTGLIKEKTSEKDKISVYGNSNIYYVLSNRMHATKYSFQYPIGKVMPNILNEYFEQLEKEKPKIIVVDSTMYDDRIKKFLDNNNYRLIFGDIGMDEITIFESNINE